jgi:uncharacterized membrane-anchored protein
MLDRQDNWDSEFSVPLSSARRDLYEELHARPFPFLLDPSQISQISYSHEGFSKQAQIAHIKILCERYKMAPPTGKDSCFYVTVEDLELRWESHTEFSTYTFISRTHEQRPFETKAINRFPKDWLKLITGDIVSAVHISVMELPEKTPGPQILRENFSGQRLIGSTVDDQQAHVWTSFLTQADGFAQILIYNRSMNECEMGRLVQRLLEIETYRLFSLLTLPLVKQSLPQLDALEIEMGDAITSIPELNSHADEKYLLEKLFRFSAEIENLRAKVSYRSSATLAYAELVDKRLSELNEDNQKGFQSLGGFLERRFYPAIRTISSVNSRLECLSTRIDRTTDLIRTKVDLELERRSQSLLSSLNNRSHRQYRLQRTIEGLSVVAISYYLVELIKLTVPGSRWLGLELNPDDVAVFTAPLILLSAVIVSGVIRRRLSKEKASD